MIVKLSGRLVEKREHSVILDLHGICYEVLVPVSVLGRIEGPSDGQGTIDLVIYHYLQLTPSSGNDVLVGFLNEIERDFFLHFIKVSGIGPRAAVKALNKPISEIAQAINEGDQSFLKTLPGIGLQKSKEIIAKLQGKVGKYGLIKDRGAVAPLASAPGWQEEALAVLLQLQYKKPEAQEMIRKALERSPGIGTTEDLLNEIYKQRINV
ncbi:MAG: Holliday junction branch migration protein RuvA [Candidatus Omnitrophota bacterium]|nr:Holliday junction branch migration protein RuvA [Candidatus Omnitrophota bacterium]MDZ4242815.1 Holliday junction branch migration protein RuvA [Candidatus Omnitrophota bacterium]